MIRQSVLPRVVAGACCGVAATIPMTAVMLWWQRRLPPSSQERQEPRQIVDQLADSAGDPAAELPESTRRNIALLAHFGYGAAMGGAFGALEPWLPEVPGRGLAYGLALYAVSYAGWLPATGILPPPTGRPTGRNALLVAAHLTWGAALEIGWNSYRRRITEDSPRTRQTGRNG